MRDAHRGGTDEFTVHCPSPVCQTVTNASAELRGRPPLFPPVADHDTATTSYGTPVTIPVTADDVAYAGGVRTGSVDLYAGDGEHGLRVDATGGGWCGAELPEPMDLSATSALAYELRSLDAGTSTSVAFQTGAGHTWCRSSWGHQNPGITATVRIDLLSGLSCPHEDLADVRGIYVWVSPGAFHLDAVRAE